MPDIKPNPFDRPGKKPVRPFSPEEGCLTVGVGAGLLLLSMIFWGWFYWQNNPEFHPERASSSPGTERSQRKRATPGLNP